jgi:hypothetical protein
MNRTPRTLAAPSSRICRIHDFELGCRDDPEQDADVTEPAAPQVDPRKVRMGLIVIAIVVVVAAVLVAVLDDPLGRAVMLAVAAVGIVRAFLLTRSLRRG